MLARHLVLYDIARQVYRMAGHWDFMKHLRLPPTLPAFDVGGVALEHRRGGAEYAVSSSSTRVTYTSTSAATCPRLTLGGC